MRNWKLKKKIIERKYKDLLDFFRSIRAKEEKNPSIRKQKHWTNRFECINEWKDLILQIEVHNPD